MYLFCSCSEPSIGKSSNVGLTNCLCGLPRPWPNVSLDMSGVIEETEACSDETESESTSNISTFEGVSGVIAADPCLVKDLGVINRDFGNKCCDEPRSEGGVGIPSAFLLALDSFSCSKACSLLLKSLKICKLFFELYILLTLLGLVTI